MSCSKQTVIAIIKNGRNFWVGSNDCKNPQDVCPRDKEKFVSGEGYELCKDVCGQEHHAEIDACLKAGKENCKGNVIYLIGHHYCCQNCKDFMKDYGIEMVFFADTGCMTKLI